MKEYTGSFAGHVPWIMTKDQRGPTCGLSAISIAYRILTGWTLFSTKGQYREFNSEQYQREVKKGEENALVLRKVAKDLGMTAAGEIVNADDLAELAGSCEGISAQVKAIAAEDFIAQVRKDIKAGGVPLVLFYVIPDDEWVEHTPDRKGLFQHWVSVFSVEENGQWLYVNITSINNNKPLTIPTTEVATANQIMVWSWGGPWVASGNTFATASALSIDWVTGKSRKWVKTQSNGSLGWDEILPSSPEYEEQPKLAKVRYSQREPTRDLGFTGYVLLTRS